MEFLSAKDYTPVLLEIKEFNRRESKGTCVSRYAGFMSGKHIYARLAETTLNSSDYPMYIRVRCGKTRGFENFVQLSEAKTAISSAIVKELDFLEGTSLIDNKRVCSFGAEEPAAGIIDQLWSSELRC